jgi:hypothetical protein
MLDRCREDQVWREKDELEFSCEAAGEPEYLADGEVLKRHSLENQRWEQDLKRLIQLIRATEEAEAA